MIERRLGPLSIDVREACREATEATEYSELSTTHGPYDLHGIPLAEDDLSKLLPAQYGAIIGHRDEFDVHAVFSKEPLQGGGPVQLSNLAVDREGDYP